jgi:hypothetical protein
VNEADLWNDPEQDGSVMNWKTTRKEVMLAINQKEKKIVGRKKMLENVYESIKWK